MSGDSTRVLRVELERHLYIGTAIPSVSVIAEREARQQIVQHGHPISASVCIYFCNASVFVYVRTYVQYSARAHKRSWESYGDP